jgi:hypothetical protein
MNKLKIGIVGVPAIGSLVVIGAYFHVRMREKDETLVEQTDRIARLEAENERLSNLVVNAKTDVLEPSEPSRELLRLRGEVGVLRQQTNELSAQDQFIVRQNQAADATRALLHALMTYATNHNGQFPANLDQLVTAGDLEAASLPGNLGPSDFEFSTTDPHILATVRLRVPIAKPGGGAIVLVGGINEFGQPFTSVWHGPTP